uniref:Uncharacterized protein n=1 Tax=Glossina palpalis gambiensis TaxID=67801 RepID=A0A1B0B9A4_9MUSC
MHRRVNIYRHKYIYIYKYIFFCLSINTLYWLISF